MLLAGIATRYFTDQSKYIFLFVHVDPSMLVHSSLITTYSSPIFEFVSLAKMMFLGRKELGLGLMFESLGNLM